MHATAFQIWSLTGKGVVVNNRNQTISLLATVSGKVRTSRWFPRVFTNTLAIERELENET